MPDIKGGPASRLRVDYERIALAGVKRMHQLGSRDAQTEPLLHDSLDRLLEVGLAHREGEVITLQRPEYGSGVELGEDARALLYALYESWLRATDGDTQAADEVLWGESGYWQHWWNMLHDGSATGPVPLRMDAIVGTDFGQRRWLSELDPILVEHVFGHGLIAGRVIVPRSTLDSPAEGLVDYALRSGIDIRVLPASSPYVLYNGTSVVLPEHDADGTEGHRLIRRSSVVRPLQTLFELRWASAIPWNDYRNGSAGVLHLLARGWSDERIAERLGISGRTVSRRVARAMLIAGARSRFELGMKYALTEHRDVTE